MKTSTGRGHVLLGLSTGKLHFIPSRLLCSCKSKSRNEWVWSCELSLIFFHMLHCIKCSVGLDANIALLLLQSSPVYCHHLWNSKQQRKSSIHLHTFPIPCCFHHSSPPPLRWQRLSHRPPNRTLPLLKDDEWSAELQVKDDVWSPAADGSASVTAHQWKTWWTSSWKRALIKEPPAQQHASAAHPWSAVTAAGYNKIALRVIGVFGDVTTSTFHKCQSQMSLVGPSLIFLRTISHPHLIVHFPATHPGISGKFSIRDQQRFNNRSLH